MYKEKNDDIINKAGTYLKGYSNGKNYIQTLRALNAAKKMHGDQMRKDGERYIDHPIKVASELLALQMDTDELLATALLHDVLEDCNVTGIELISKFNINENIVNNLNILNKKGKTTDFYYNEISKNKVCSLVKISDRCHNVSTMVGGFSEEKILSYIEETYDYVLPLCRNLRNFYPECSNQIFLMKYHIESICKMGNFLIKKES